MGMQPTAEHVELARRIGHWYARRRGHFSLEADYVSEAVAVLYEQLARRDDVDDGMVGAIVRNRLCDWDRAQHGRNAHRRAPHANSVSFDAMGIEDGFDAPDTGPSVEEQVCEGERLGIDRVIELIGYAAGVERAGQSELICRWLSEGRGFGWIAGELGISDSRVSQLVAELGDRVRSHQLAASILCA